MTTRVALCEGYQDRAFLKGWLVSRDDLGPVRGSGVFGFSRGATHLRVQPCGGEALLMDRARNLLCGGATCPIDRIVLVGDRDDRAEDPGPARVRTLQREFPGADVRSLTWTCDDQSLGFPTDRRNLERVVCAPLAEVHADRAADVERWLADAPEEPRHKQHARAWHAKWWADHGCEEFYEHLWSDAAVAACLERTLSPALNVLRELAT